MTAKWMNAPQTGSSLSYENILFSPASLCLAYITVVTVNIPQIITQVFKSSHRLLSYPAQS